MTDNQNPPYGPGGPGQPGQPGQAGYPGQGGYPGQQPPQGPPPGHGPPPGYGQQPPAQPPYGGQPGQPGPGQPGQGQAPYGGQPGQPPYGGQPGQGGQPGYPPQGQWNQGGPGGPAGWGPGGAPAPKKSNAQLLVLAIGGFVVVAIIGAVLAFTLNRGDDNEADPGPGLNTQPTQSPTTDPTADPTADPSGDPTTDPTTEPTAGPTPEPTDGPTGGPDGKDAGIDAGNGVFVRPAPGYIRATPKGATGVYLKKDGQGAFWVQTGKGTSAEVASVMTQAINAEKKNMANWQITAPKVETPPAGSQTKITKLTSVQWTGELTGQSGTVKLVGYIGIIERNDGVLTLARFYSLRSAAGLARVELKSMMGSVVQSQ